MDIRVILFGIGATAIGYHLWKSGSRASSLMRGTATAKIATAAKGYAELQGRASAPSESQLRDPITNNPCVWFSIQTEEFSILDKFRWKTVKTARSSRPFVIDDGSARCLISPADVSIDIRGEDTIVKERWDLRHKVWWIREGNSVYAIGYLQRTTDLTVQTILRDPGLRNSAPQVSDDQRDEHDLTRRATEILRAWKRNPGKYIAKFDSDGNGRIDAEEWDAVRAAARAEAAKKAGLPPAACASPRDADDPVVTNDITHRLVKPADGRPFLLSTHGEASLVSSNRTQAFWGLVFFVIGVMTLLSLLHSCFGGK